MRIAFAIINANRREGTSRAILEVAERLSDRHEVDLWARTVEDADLGKLNWIRVPGPGRPEVGDFATYKWSVDRRINKSNYDIIHTAGPNTSMADVYAVQTVHPMKMSQMLAVNANASAGWARRFSRRVYDRQVVAAEIESYSHCGPRGPRAFLPVSQGTKEELLSTYPKTVYRRSAETNTPEESWRSNGADGDCEACFDNVRIVPNGADLEKFNPKNRDAWRSEIRKRHRIAKDDFVLLFSGGDWRRKGLDLALQALANISDPRVKLLVAGHDRGGEDIKHLAKQLGLVDRVCFAGFREDVHCYYAAGDLFVFPTAYEAFSLATIEAAAAGLPVLMPAVSGSEELIGRGDTGSIIRRDPEHIAATVLEYVQIPQRTEREGRSARELVEREFSWDVITERTENLYLELLAERRRVAFNRTSNTLTPA